MAQITLTISDDHITEILNAYDSIFPGRGGATKAAWAKAIVANHIKSVVKEYRIREAQKTASSQEVSIT